MLWPYTNCSALYDPQVYANGSAVPFMIPPFAAAAAASGSPLYPVMRPVKVESEW